MASGNGRKVLVASEVGFCFGVKRAINVTRQALEENKEVFILGELIHNRHVTDELEARGLRKLEEYGDNPGGTMVIRAHGLPVARIQEAEQRGFEVIDATCPIVHRAQEAAQELESRGCQVVVIGDRNHAEVKGILGALTKGNALVIDSVEELRQAKADYRLLRKVGVIFQTTHALELCKAILDELVFMCKEVQIINTICRPVQNRQDDALEIAAQVDLMIVVGSRTSANTRELAALCSQHNPRTLHIQTADELAEGDFLWAESVGIASGLSTPEEIVESVRRKVEDYEGVPEPHRMPDPSRFAIARH